MSLWIRFLCFMIIFSDTLCNVKEEEMRSKSSYESLGLCVCVCV